MNPAADLALFYVDFPAVDVSYTPLAGTASVGRAIFDQPGMTLIGGEVLATDYSLRYPATTFPNVKRGDAFGIGGVNYTARENAQPLIDGAEHTVPLAKA